MMTDTVIFDLETQYLADEVGGWDHIRDMRLSVGVTYHVEEAVYRVYAEAEVERLIDALRQADLVVGYNVLRFDYEVLRAYAATDDLFDAVPTVDMLKDLRQALGWRPKLDSVASATLGETKSADGLQAVYWFRQGLVDQVIDYCRRDVEVTWRVYQFGQQNGYVQCRDRRWRLHKVPVPW